MNTSACASGSTLQHNQLIAADTEPAVSNAAHDMGRQNKLLFACVQHHEIVAGAVHFYKGDGHARSVARGLRRREAKERKRYFL